MQEKKVTTNAVIKISPPPPPPQLLCTLPYLESSSARRPFVFRRCRVAATDKYSTGEEGAALALLLTSPGGGGHEKKKNIAKLRQEVLSQPPPTTLPAPLANWVRKKFESFVEFPSRSFFSATAFYVFWVRPPPPPPPASFPIQSRVTTEPD